MAHKHLLETFRLDGRVALVTGGARGLGKAMATTLAEAGAAATRLDDVTVSRRRWRRAWARSTSSSTTPGRQPQGPSCHARRG